MAVHGLAILLGRNEAGISNRGKKNFHHAVQGDHSGRLQPPVDLVPTVLAASGPLLRASRFHGFTS